MRLLKQIATTPESRLPLGAQGCEAVRARCLVSSVWSGIRYQEYGLVSRSGFRCLVAEFLSSVETPIRSSLLSPDHVPSGPGPALKHTQSYSQNKQTNSKERTNLPMGKSLFVHFAESDDGSGPRRNNQLCSWNDPRQFAPSSACNNKPK